MCTLFLYPESADNRRRPDAMPDALPPPPPRYICRRLFQDGGTALPRPSALLKSLEAELEQQSTEKWNFNFRTGVPLAGRYDWVSVVRRPRTESAVAEVPRTETTVARHQGSADRSTSKKTTTTTQQSKITGRRPFGGEHNSLRFFYVHSNVPFSEPSYHTG